MPLQGGLRQSLLNHAVALTREGGPDAVSLREVQRRSGVSSAAAYRHYRDREALLFAVGQRASALLADHIQTALDDLPPDESAYDAAVNRLGAGFMAYLDFVRREPGLFHAVLMTGEDLGHLESPERPSQGSRGRGPYEILQLCLADLEAIGLLSADDVPYSDIAVWAATHGLATLMLDGPLRQLDDTQQQAAAQRLLDVILTGLMSPGCPRREG